MHSSKAPSTVADTFRAIRFMVHTPLSRKQPFNGENRPILLKNSVSARGRKISRDMARLDLEVPRDYRPKALASPESSLFGSMQTYRQFSLSTSSWRKPLAPRNGVFQQNRPTPADRERPLCSQRGPRFIHLTVLRIPGTTSWLGPSKKALLPPSSVKRWIFARSLAKGICVCSHLGAAQPPFDAIDAVGPLMGIIATVKGAPMSRFRSWISPPSR